MSSQVRNAIISLVVLSGVAVYSYYNFANFKPKVLIPLREVHGAKTSLKVTLPYPEGAVILGETVSEGGEQRTFQIEKSSEEVQSFYKNVLETDEWELDNQGDTGIFVVSEYKKDKRRIKIATSSEFEQTIVSIEVTQ